MKLFAAVAIAFALTRCRWRCTLATQEERGRGAPATARDAAAIDLTGYWVSVISEDWKFRMVTPRKGVYDSLMLNAEGRRVADAWDPARKDEAAGEQVPRVRRGVDQHARARPAAHHMAGRQYAEDRDRRRHA